MSRHGTRSSGAELDVALWSADEGVKAGFVAALDGEVKADAFESRGEFLGIVAQDFKIVQGAFCRCILGRVNRVGAPFDEEGEKAMAAMSGGWTAQPIRRGSVMERSCG